MSRSSETTGSDGQPIPDLQVRLFGTLSVHVQGAPLPPLRTRKGAWLLALLLLKHPRPVDRAWLAGTLWPDTDPAAALKNLRNTLADLRHTLGPQHTRIHSPTPSTLALDLAGADVDLIAFDAAIAGNDLTALDQAVRLYTGPLLEGCGEEWVVLEREQRQQSCLHALEALAAAELQRGQAGQAVQRLRRCVSLDALRETAQSALISALAASGDYAGATQTYRDFRVRLHEELHTQPATATTALYQQIRVRARQAAAHSASLLPSRYSKPASQPSDLAPLEEWGSSESADVHADLLPRKRLDPPDLPNNLPQQADSFIGREKEVARVRALLQRTRLLTLIGSGGCGKTRLSLHIAAEVFDEYADGVRQVELAPLSDPSLVAQTVAQALGIQEQAGQAMIQTLLDRLKSKRLLLLLDNCEHLLGACAQVAAELLRSCPHVQLLATSRERLGIAGEQTYRIPPLSLPDLKRSFTWESLSQYEAVRLFIERALLVKADFRLTNTNAPAVASICHRLDGIPLAIELAAARVRLLTVENIDSRLDNRFRLLIGGDRMALPRQQTLRALMDWSYDLLNAEEKLLLSHLSVFAGGWTLEAAEAVCSDFGFWILDFGLSRAPSEETTSGSESDPRNKFGVRKQTLNETSAVQNPKSKIQNEEVLDLLGSLVDKSLVIAEEQEGTVRYRMLETVRAYATEKLQMSGATEQVHNQHRDWFLMLAEEAEPHLHGPEAALWLARLDAEHDNMRAAVAWCVAATGGAEAGLRLTGAMWRFWRVRGYIGEGLNHLQRALAREGAEGRTAVRARALYGAGILAGRQDESALARIFHEEAVMLWRELEVPDQIACSVHELANLAFWQGDHGRMQALHAEALTIWRELGDQWGIGESAINRGLFAYVQGDYPQAHILYEEGLMIMRELGNPEGIAWALLSLAAATSALGNPSRARSLREEALAIARAVGDKANLAWALKSLADAALEQGDHSQARTLYSEAVMILQEIEQRGHYADAICKLADMAFDQGNCAEAHALYTESLTIHREMGRELHNLLGVARSMQGLAGVLLTQGDGRKAVRLLGVVKALSTSTGFVLPPHDWVRYDRQVVQARTALGDEAFLAAWTEGQALPPEQATVYALDLPELI